MSVKIFLLLLQTFNFCCGILFGYFFCSISFSHAHRMGNSIVHSLAKHSRHVSSYLVWMEDFPPKLHDVLLTYFG